MCSRIEFYRLKLFVYRLDGLFLANIYAMYTMTMNLSWERRKRKASNAIWYASLWRLWCNSIWCGNEERSCLHIRQNVLIGRQEIENLARFVMKNSEELWTFMTNHQLKFLFQVIMSRCFRWFTTKLIHMEAPELNLEFLVFVFRHNCFFIKK